MPEHRIDLDWDREGPESDLVCARLAPGAWLVGHGCRPPPAHAPAALLADIAGLAGQVAISLRTDSAIRTSVVPALLLWLARHGCALPPLAEVAVHEIAVNALLHGNLGIASGPAAQWTDLEARHARMDAALADPARAGRCLTLAAGWGAAAVVIAIADEGEGYDPQAEVASGPGAGRGLALTRRVVQAMEVRQGGRCTRLVFAPCP